MVIHEWFTDIPPYRNQPTDLEFFSGKLDGKVLLRAGVRMASKTQVTRYPTPPSSQFEYTALRWPERYRQDVWARVSWERPELSLIRVLMVRMFVDPAGGLLTVTFCQRNGWGVDDEWRRVLEPVLLVVAQEVLPVVWDKLDAQIASLVEESKSDT